MDSCCQSSMNQGLKNNHSEQSRYNEAGLGSILYRNDNIQSCSSSIIGTPQHDVQLRPNSKASNLSSITPTTNKQQPTMSSITPTTNKQQPTMSSSRSAHNSELLRQLKASAKTLTKLRNIIEDANVECVQVAEELHQLALDSSQQQSTLDLQTDSESPQQDSQALTDIERVCCSHAQKLSPKAEESPSAVETHELKLCECAADVRPEGGQETLSQIGDDPAFNSLNALEEKVSSLKNRLVELEEMKLIQEVQWNHRKETVATDLRVMRSLVLALRPAAQEVTPSKSDLVQLLEECDGQLEELCSQHSALDAFFAGLDRRLISSDTSPDVSSPDDSQCGTDTHAWGRLELQRETPKLSPTTGSCDVEEDGTNESASLDRASNGKNTLTSSNSNGNTTNYEGAVAVTAPIMDKDENTTVAVRKPSARMRRLVAVMSGAATTVNGLLAMMSGAAVTFHGIVGATTSSVGTAAGAVGVANGAMVTLNGLAGAVGGAAATLTGRVGLVRGVAGTINGLAGTVAGTAGMISGAVGAATSTAGSFGAMVSIIRGSAGTLGGMVGVVRGTASSISAVFRDPS